MLTIAIDGTSSSGKGIVCTKLAQKLGVVHFDTGAIYRALGVYVMDNNIDPYNEGEVEKSLKDITITLKHNNGEQITILNNIDVSNKIRLNKVSDICSIIAPYQKCREFVLNIQRNSSKKFDLIMGKNLEELEKDYSLYYILATCYMLEKDNKNAIEFLEFL